MNVAFDVPTDGPDAVLSHVARLVGAPHDRVQVARAVAAHPRPTSLLAVVDVGAQLGLNMTPAKSNAAGLSALTGPLIAHFQSGEHGGFAVVERILSGDVEVWDSIHGTQIVDRGAFLEHWSGVIVLVQAPQAAASPRLHRLQKLLSGPAEPPAVTGTRSIPIVRGILVALVITSVAATIAAQPADTRAASAALAVLSAVGLAISALMSIAIADYGGPFAPGICRRGRFVDCQSVLTSRFARVAGIPLSDLGIAFYGGVLLLVATAGTSPGALRVIATLFIASVPVAAILIALQLVLRRLCTLCLAVHAVNGLAAAIAWTSFPVGATRAEDLRMAALFALFASIVVFFVIPYLKQNAAHARLVLTYGRMSGSPFSSLAQLATEEPTPVIGRDCGIEIGGAAAHDEIVAFVHPSCKQCDPVLRELRALAAGGRVSAYMTVPPRDRNEQQLCAAILGLGVAFDADRMLRAFAIAKERFGDVARDPVAVIASELSIAPSEVETAAAEAERLVGRTRELAAVHVEGTPALFFNSLPFRGPVAHLVTLLSQHADLLPRPQRPPAPHPAPDAAVKT